MRDETVVDFASSLARRLREIGDTNAVAWPSPRYRRDPVAFAREVLGVEPWSKQVEILEAARDHKRVAVKSGHKVSKSHSAACLAWWFFCSFEDARVVMSSTTARQVDAILYRELRKIRAKAKKPLEDGDNIGELARTGVKARDFREIVGFTAREAEAVAGVSGANLLYILDEASGIPDAIFEAIEGNRAGGARLVMFSNPTRTEGEFFEAFESKSEFYHCVSVSSEDTPNVKEGREVIPGLATREWVEEKRQEWGEESALFRVRVKGEFVRHEEGKILSLHALGLAEERWSETSPSGRLQIGLDPAGAGLFGDETVITGRRGQKQIAITAHRGLTGDGVVVQLLDFIRAHAEDGEIPIVCLDREGPIGSEILGLLRAHVGMNPISLELFAIRASDKAPRNPHLYGTLRDELWANLATWIDEGGSIVEDDKQTRELHAPSWEPVASYGMNASRIKVTDKRELKKALGRSPDRADALALAVWDVTSQLRETPTTTRSREHEAELGEPIHDAGAVFDPYGGAG